MSGMETTQPTTDLPVIFPDPEVSRRGFLQTGGALSGDDALHLQAQRRRRREECLQRVAVAALEGLARGLDRGRSRTPGEMKRAFFEGDPDEPIILHRKEIMGRSGIFSVLEDDARRAEFDAAFLEIVNNLFREKWQRVAAVGSAWQRVAVVLMGKEFCPKNRC